MIAVRTDHAFREGPFEGLSQGVCPNPIKGQWLGRFNPEGIHPMATRPPIGFRYYDDLLTDFDVFYELVQDGLIEIDFTFGVAYQTHNFRSGIYCGRTQMKTGEYNGYPTLTAEVLRSESDPEPREINVFLHRLIWVCAGNDPPPNWKQLHHCDGNKLNPGLFNLELLTKDAHQQVGKQTGVHLHPNNVPTIPVNHPVIKTIKQLRELNTPIRTIANQVQINKNTVHRIINNTYNFAPPDPAYPPPPTQV
jgi:hypothetical protein